MRRGEDSSRRRQSSRDRRTDIGYKRPRDSKAHERGVVVQPRQAATQQHYANGPRIDRESVCPFLLRLFYKEGRSHTLEDFDGDKIQNDKEELHIYTWMDANLREISEHVQRELEPSRKRDTELEFSLVYPDFSGSYRRKHLGTVRVGQKGPDDLKTLLQLRFVIGDFISLAIIEAKGEQGSAHAHQTINVFQDYKLGLVYWKQCYTKRGKQESI